MRVLVFVMFTLLVGCASAKPQYTYGTVEVADGQARLPETTLTRTWDGKIAFSLVSVIGEPDTAAMKVVRTGEHFFWSGCDDVNFVYGPNEKENMTAVSHRKDFTETGDHLEILSFVVDGEDLRGLTLGESPAFLICGESFELKPAHQRYISEFIDAWNGVIQR